jgi:membrane protease subunit (stomatin/prohibitin family)
MTNIINLTPHNITLIDNNNNIVDVFQSAGLARVDSNTCQVSTVNGIPVNTVKFGNVTGLPDPQDDTFFVVSRIVADAVKGTRNDILIVDKTVRNDAGQIIGCQAFAVV